MGPLGAFLAVITIGGLLCGVIWHFAHQRIRRSWRWRALFSLLIATSISPTVVDMWGRPFVFPAAFCAAAVLSLDEAALKIGLWHGIVPILIVASIAFGTLKVILGRPDPMASHSAEQAPYNNQSRARGVILWCSVGWLLFSELPVGGGSRSRGLD